MSVRSPVAPAAAARYTRGVAAPSFSVVRD